MTDSTRQSKPFILGVSGGSGSGKTYFAKDLQKTLGKDKSGHNICEIVYQDNFYIDQSKKFDFDGGSVNFDHPESIDFDLLGQRLASLKEGSPVEIPIYDFATHSRKLETYQVKPCAVIIVDGILIFHASQVRQFFDDMIFFDSPEDLRFQRRLERDVKERGRTPEGVHSQFYKQVKPMHDQFVQPSKDFASTVVDECSNYSEVLNRYKDLLRAKLHI